jgi:hypothetical protein
MIIPCSTKDSVSAPDHGTNDCAVAALDARTGEERHTAIVPHGTRFLRPCRTAGGASTRSRECG